MEVSLGECHIFECGKCYEKSLIFDPPRNGDTILQKETKSRRDL